MYINTARARPDRISRDESPIMLTTRRTSDPLYLQVKRALQEGIRSGDFPPASRLPSQVELCEQYNVSQITIQRALRELAEEGYLEARPGRGTYVLGGRATPMITRTRTIAIILGDVLSAYRTSKPMFDGITELCRADGYGIMPLVLPDATDDDASDYGSLTACAGAICSSPVDLQVVAWMQRQQMPYVLLYNDVADQHSHCVSCNFASGVARATHHLFDQGCRRIALLTTEEAFFSAGQMRLGFQLAHESTGRMFDRDDVIHIHRQPEDVGPIVEQWIAEDTAPDGLICANDEITTAAMTLFAEAGYDVPRRVAVVGVGNAVTVKPPAPSVTMVETRIAETGRAAARMLMQLIEGNADAPHRMMTEPRLVIRESSRRQSS